jgi:hypothetical protein
LWMPSSLFFLKCTDTSLMFHQAPCRQRS